MPHRRLHMHAAAYKPTTVTSPQAWGHLASPSYPVLGQPQRFPSVLCPVHHSLSHSSPAFAGLCLFLLLCLPTTICNFSWKRVNFSFCVASLAFANFKPSLRSIHIVAHEPLVHDHRTTSLAQRSRDRLNIMSSEPLAASSSLPLRSALKSEDDVDRTPPASGTLKGSHAHASTTSPETTPS